MGLPGCLFVCHLILLRMCFLFNWGGSAILSSIRENALALEQ